MTRLARLSAEEFAPYVDACVEIYVVAMGKPREVVPTRRAITRRHLTHPGLRAVIARSDGGLIGFAYGYYGEAGQWWHDAVADALTSKERRRWLSNAFEVAEVHVLPAWQQQGIGRQLLHELCADVDRATVVLSAIDHETPARKLYASVGFTDVLRGFVFPGSSEQYAVMARRLPLDTVSAATKPQ